MFIKRGLLQIALAALLLAAQHGALMHHVRHAQECLPLPTQQQDQDKNAAHSGLCAFHISFAQVLGAVDCARLPLRIATNRVEDGVAHLPLAFPADLVVPASRGPPVLL